jgi:hypothetical protein
MQKVHRELTGTVDGASAFEKANTLADNVFKGLENDYQKTKAFEQLLGYIKPVQVKLAMQPGNSRKIPVNKSSCIWLYCSFHSISSSTSVNA